MGDPAAEKPGTSRKFYARKTGMATVGGKELFDLGSQEGGDFLVGVEGEHPWLRAGVERDILLGLKILPGVVNYECTEALGDRGSGVGAVIRHDHDLRAPIRHTAQAPLKIIRFVASDEGNTEGKTMSGRHRVERR